MRRFEISGAVNGVATTIEWSPTEGFTDPSGEVEAMIATGEWVKATPTGPSYAASGTDGLLPAFLTALRAFDDPTALRDGEGCDAAREALAEAIALPDGVIS